ncbi:MAG: DUF3592 domain-containing protein [Myxococcota bacterium]
MDPHQEGRRLASGLCFGVALAIAVVFSVARYRAMDLRDNGVPATATVVDKHEVSFENTQSFILTLQLASPEGEVIEIEDSVAYDRYATSEPGRTFEVRYDADDPERLAYLSDQTYDNRWIYGVSGVLSLVGLVLAWAGFLRRAKPVMSESFGSDWYDRSARVRYNNEFDQLPIRIGRDYRSIGAIPLAVGGVIQLAVLWLGAEGRVTEVAVLSSIGGLAILAGVALFSAARFVEIVEGEVRTSFGVLPYTDARTEPIGEFHLVLHHDNVLHWRLTLRHRTDRGRRILLVSRTGDPDYALAQSLAQTIGLPLHDETHRR